MSTAHEQLSRQFYQWELRGRGWHVYDEPVQLEPPFVPFTRRYLANEPVVDDGRRPTFLSSLAGKILKAKDLPVAVEPEEDIEPAPLVRNSLVELQTVVSEDLDITRDEFEHFLSNLALCREPIAFELLGTQNKIAAQFVVSSADVSLVRRQLQTHFSETIFKPAENVLAKAWATCSGKEELAMEFGLGREFMLLLACGKLDSFIGIIGALSELQADELGLFQVLWQPVNEKWQSTIVEAVQNNDGKAFFLNMPELTRAAEEKASKPLYAVVVRVATKAGTFDRALEIARDLASALRVFAKTGSNELIPLKNDEYPFEAHIEDVIQRQSRRTGMLLNTDELIGFVHLPSSAIQSPLLQRQTGKEAPLIVRQPDGILLGHNLHLGEKIPIRLVPEQRVYHTHIIGATGTGKSTLLFNLIRQDIENNQGLAVLDPHGDLIDRILGVIPKERIHDVILVDPTDEESSIGFNLLSAHSEQEKALLASDLISVFQRLSTSWGDQMQSVLQHAILAFLYSSRVGTLGDLQRFLVEPQFREQFLKSVSDRNVLYYWNTGFKHLSGNKSIGPILTRLEMFLAQRPIAHMVLQRENRLNFGDIMDGGKILLAKLPEGMLGKENSYLLGAVLVSKFQQLVMARQAKKVAARRDFWIYIDEFANFITPSMAEILSGARKYRIGLTLAHHELHQLQRSPDVASAVMTHPYTRIVFRVGDDDSRKLADSFSSFEANDLKNLERSQAICRVERSNFDFNLSIPLPHLPSEEEMRPRQQEVILASRVAYATPRTQVEAELLKTWNVEMPRPKPAEERPLTPVPIAPIEPSPPVIEKLEPKTELPKVTVSEKKMANAPRDLGRGGAQHQAIQQRLKVIAEELRFRSIIEKPILDGQGSVDLLLVRDRQSIACEISISTTIDHEVGNVSKCLKAGFPEVAVICLEPERLRKIEAAVLGSLGPEMAAHVRYFEPDQFIAYLEEKKVPSPQATESIEVRRGYRVKRNTVGMSPGEQKGREEDAIRLIAESMRRK